MSMSPGGLGRLPTTVVGMGDSRAMVSNQSSHSKGMVQGTFQSEWRVFPECSWTNTADRGHEGFEGYLALLPVRHVADRDAPAAGLLLPDEDRIPRLNRVRVVEVLRRPSADEIDVRAQPRGTRGPPRPCPASRRRSGSRRHRAGSLVRTRLPRPRP